MKLQKKHRVISFAEVDPTLLTKPDKPPLLIRPTDQEFVQDLALHMMKNPIAVVAPWLCVVIGDKSKCQKILESSDMFSFQKLSCLI